MPFSSLGGMHISLFKVTEPVGEYVTESVMHACVMPEDAFPVKTLHFSSVL